MTVVQSDPLGEDISNVERVKSALNLCETGRLGECILELETLRSGGSMLASFQLALIEKNLNEKFLQSPYFRELLNEAAQRGHVLAQKSEVVRKSTTVSTRLRWFFDSLIGINNEEKFVWFEPNVSDNKNLEKELYYAIVSMKKVEGETEHTSNFLVGLWAFSKEEYQVTIGFYVREDGYSINSIGPVFDHCHRPVDLADKQKELISTMITSMGNNYSDSNFDVWYEYMD